MAFLTATVLLVATTSGQQPQPRHVLPADDWRHYGHDLGGQRHSPLQQITPDNVARLERAWTYRIGEMERTPNISPDREPPAFQCTPVAVKGVLYLVTPASRVIALDAETGAERWQFDPQSGTSRRGYHQIRGLAYWEGPGAAPERRIV